MNVFNIKNVYPRAVDKTARAVSVIADRFYKNYWYNFPYGKSALGDKNLYTALWENTKSKQFPELDQFEKNCGFAIERDWMDNLALHTQIVIKEGELCYQHGRVLYSTLRKYISTKENSSFLVIYETGTARGFSSLVLARALSDSAACGRIFTFDLVPHGRRMFWNCIDDHYGPQSREELLKPWEKLVRRYVTFINGESRIQLEKVNSGRINFAFLDGAHTYDDVMFEMTLVSGRQNKDDVIVFDDYSIKSFPGVVRAVDEGCRIFGYSKTVVTISQERSYVVARRC